MALGRGPDQVTPGPPPIVTECAGTQSAIEVTGPNTRQSSEPRDCPARHSERCVDRASVESDRRARVSTEDGATRQTYRISSFDSDFKLCCCLARLAGVIEPAILPALLTDRDESLLVLGEMSFFLTRTRRGGYAWQCFCLHCDIAVPLHRISVTVPCVRAGLRRLLDQD